MLELELQDAAVFMLRDINCEKSAAAYARGVDGKPDAGVRLVRKSDVRDGEVPARIPEAHAGQHACTVDQRLERANRKSYGGRQLRLKARVTCAQTQVDDGHL